MTGLTRTLALGVRRWLTLSFLAMSTISTPALLACVLFPLPALAQDRASSAATPDPSPETRGDTRIIERRYVEAIEAYREAPDGSAAVANKLGIAYEHLFSLELAKRSYERALAIDPKYADALNNLGTICYAQKDYGSAERFYKKSLKLQRNPAVLANLSTLYYAEQKYRQGKDAYQKAFAMSPSLFTGKGDSTNRIEEALPRDARAAMHFDEAKSFAGAGRADLAIDSLRQAIDEGFSNRKLILQDKDFATLRETPKFQQLLDRGMR